MGEPGRGTGQNAAVCSRIMDRVQRGILCREFVELRGQFPGDRDEMDRDYEAKTRAISMSQLCRKNYEK